VGAKPRAQAVHEESVEGDMVRAFNTTECFHEVWPTKRRRA
jgi:hypothetical protein